MSIHLRYSSSLILYSSPSLADESRQSRTNRLLRTATASRAKTVNRQSLIINRQFIS